MRKKRRTFAPSTYIAVNDVSAVLINFMDKSELERMEQSKRSWTMTREEYERHFGPYPGGDEPA